MNANSARGVMRDRKIILSNRAYREIMELIETAALQNQDHITISYAGENNFSYVSEFIEYVETYLKEDGYNTNLMTPPNRDVTKPITQFIMKIDWAE